ncbi:MAG: HAMP domain-containing sensor histidine kinase [Actinomycetota bacterium]|nr:HAMP domain-containing sensor histidine kinase [Actinomycetota bacterium]
MSARSIVPTSVAGATAVVVTGAAVLEMVMQPSATDRFEAVALFAAMGALTVAASRAVSRRGPRWRSLSRTIAVVGLVAVSLIGLAVGVGAWRMFLSVHDLQLVGVVLLVGASLGIVFATSVARCLEVDLAAVRRTADGVSNGDLDARTGVERADEIGAAAAALDEMVGRLAIADAQRRRDDEARRALLAAIGHDLRTPLAALQASIEALQDGLAPEPDRYLRSMGRDVATLRSMVDDLFLLARIEAGELVTNRQALDLAELADETVDAMASLARRQQVELHLDATGRVPVWGGPEALGRVMRNLVDNAIRHAPAGSRVVVRVTDVGARDTDCALVEVLDRGPGFDAALLATAFDRFVRADPSRNRDTGGAGLGLAIARGVVEAHGGRIWAEAGPGGRVCFRLPSDRPATTGNPLVDRVAATETAGHGRGSLGDAG